ncbi:MAG TPA: GNAT family N-acetyltransferase [Candidatus Binatia bacterium]
MISPPETFESQRLQLRKPLLADAEEIFRQYAQDAEVTKYLTWLPYEKVDETRAFVRTCLLMWQQGDSYHWTLVRKGDGQLLGMINARVDGHKWELGYVLAREYWGRGYMTEAVKRLIATAFEEAAVYRVWAVCDVDNVASARVMEKSGMQREGLLRRWSVHPTSSAEPRDSFCYSIVR